MRKCLLMIWIKKRKSKCQKRQNPKYNLRPFHDEIRTFLHMNFGKRTLVSGFDKLFSPAKNVMKHINYEGKLNPKQRLTN